MKYNFIFILLISVVLLRAQVNLVPNPSFEDSVSCPAWIGDMSVSNWLSPTTASPDYFHSCNSTNAGIPQNVFGYQSARTGNAYVGVHTSDFVSTDYREYVQCELLSPLEAGKSYEVSFYVSRTDSCTKACDNLGAYLSTSAVSSSGNLNLPYTPQVVSMPNSPLTNDTGWVRVIDTIVATGGEQYLTLGVFADNVNTNWIPVSGGWDSVAHYYIDDVSVKEVLTDYIRENDALTVLVFPTPATEFITIVADQLVTSVTVCSALGHPIIAITPNSQSVQIDLTGYSPGAYCIYITIGNAIVRRKIVVT